MNDFLSQNANTILLIIRIFIIVYGVLASLGVTLRIIRHIREKGLKKSIGYIIYTVVGAIIFLVILILLYIVTDFLTHSSGI
jgi:Zn-dependent protease